MQQAFTKKHRGKEQYVLIRNGEILISAGLVERLGISSEGFVEVFLDADNLTLFLGFTELIPDNEYMQGVYKLYHQNGRGGLLFSARALQKQTFIGNYVGKKYRRVNIKPYGLKIELEP